MTKLLDAAAHDKAKSLVAASVIMIVLSAVLVFVYGFQEDYLETSLEQGKHFVVYDELRTKVTFMVSTMVVAIIIVWMNFYITDVRRRDKRPFENRLARILTLVFILTLPGSVLAGYLLDRSWYAELRNEGYSRCENNLFSLSKGFLESAWMREKSWCTDPEVRHILLKSHNKKGFREVNEYLHRTYRP